RPARARHGLVERPPQPAGPGVLAGVAAGGVPDGHALEVRPARGGVPHPPHDRDPPPPRQPREPAPITGPAPRGPWPSPRLGGRGGWLTRTGCGGGGRGGGGCLV